MVVTRAFCRLTVLSPRSRVDVSLPVDVPVAELVPMVLDLIGEPSAPGGPPVPWQLSGAAGGRLPLAATLAEIEVPDGELLRLAPAAPAPPAPVFDDPVDAVAASAARSAPWDHRFTTAVLLVVVGAAAALLAAPGPGAIGAALVAGAAAAGAVWAAGWLARRPAPGPGAAGVAALAAVPTAAAAGWSALPAMGGGSANLLLAVAMAGVAATAGQLAVRALAPPLVAVVVAAVLAGSALIGVRLGAPPQAAAGAAAGLALAIGPMLPRLAIRLAGLPRPDVPGDDPGNPGLRPGELARRAVTARGYLGGMAGGCAVVVAGGAVTAAVLDTASGGWVGACFAGVAVTALGLRSRSFADRAPAVAGVVAAVSGALGLAAVLGSAGGGLWAGGALLLAAAAGVLVLGNGPVPISPVTRRAIDIIEGALVVVAVPLAAGVMGLYELARTL